MFASQGIHDLMHDNKTEHLRTINILERFNIYQEVILAILYRLTPFKVSYAYVELFVPGQIENNISLHHSLSYNVHADKTSF